MSWRYSILTFLVITLELCTFLNVSCSNKVQNYAKFPPEINDLGTSDDPAGHLKPFGHQRPPEGPAKEYFEVLRPEIFWQDHVSKAIPLVFRQAISDSPAISKWTDEYLKKKFGDLDVLIELKKENRTHSARRTTIATFLDHYQEQDMYIVTVLPDRMRDEVQVGEKRILYQSSFAELS